MSLSLTGNFTNMIVLYLICRKMAVKKQIKYPIIASYILEFFLIIHYINSLE